MLFKEIIIVSTGFMHSVGKMQAFDVEVDGTYSSYCALKS
jgi:hypothetical protein